MNKPKSQVRRMGRRTGITGLILVLAGLLGSASAEPGPTTQTPPRILIISATRAEIDAVARRIDEPVVNANGPALALEGQMDGVDVVALQSGVSIVNASMSTQWALDTYPVRAIIVSGTTAGIDLNLSIGDVVIAEQWGKYNEIIFLRETDDGLPTQDPFGRPLPFPPYGAMAPRPARPLPRLNGPTEERFWYPANADLLAKAQDAVANIELSRCLPEPRPEQTCLETTPTVQFAEFAVSGSAFMDNIDFGRYLRGTFNASILEMETAAIAIVADANDVPFLAVRAVSDLVQVTPPGEHQYVSYFTLAAENAARVTAALVSDLDP